MRLFTLLTLLILAACTEFPALDGTIDAAARAAPYPALVDIRPLVATATDVSPPPHIGGRIAGLQARAAGLRGRAVIPRDQRRRLDEGVATTALR